MRRAILVVTIIITAVLVGTSAVAYAKQSDPTSSETTSPETTEPITIENHAWKNYHWARKTNPFTLKLGDNVESAWDSTTAPVFDTTISDWNKSTVLKTTRVTGGTNPKNCRATSGQVEVCNAKYGSNGWLGIATIWVSGDHITQGTTKLNDTYFNTAKYNTPAWRNLVMCQEVGHNFGLAHQDEDFYNGNLDTCMDYTINPETNQHPNLHDYDQLRAIYDPTFTSTWTPTQTGHLDTTTTVGQTSTSTGSDNEPGNVPSAWGREVYKSANGQVSVYEKELSKGQKKVTHVLWTEEKADQRREHKE